MTANRFLKRSDRRALLLAAISLPLSGCDSGPYGIGWDQWGKAVGVATGLEKAPDLAREQVEQIPFATIGYEIGDSSGSVLILAEKSGISSLWTSSQRLAIITAKGRILRTSGFHWNLGSTNFIEPDFLGTPLLIEPPQRKIRRLCDFPDINKFQIQIDSEFGDQRSESIVILDSKIETVRVTERCHCSVLDWAFDNYHWADPKTGFVWQTAQYVHPNEAAFTITILRPEA